MKWLISLLALLSLALLTFVLLSQSSTEELRDPLVYLTDSVADTTKARAPLTEVIAENLTIPWEILFLPDGELLVTERPGRILLLTQDVEIPISGIKHTGEGGLLGATLHPDFSENNFLYLYQTTESQNGLENQINRYVLKNNALTFDRTIVEGIPGAKYHDGGRIVFGPDGLLYVTVGDALNKRAAQDTSRLEGSILRYTGEGHIPEDNPFQNAVYSYGHRNPQGIAWDANGNLWSTEHGRSGVLSGLDELNLITPAGNYGWPEIQGDEEMPSMQSPIRHSGADTTWAPGSLAYLNGSLYFAGLRGEALHEAVLDGTEVVSFRSHFSGEYGRLRTVTVGPDDLLYVTTSNRDGRGEPEVTDDRIIRINPDLLSR